MPLNGKTTKAMSRAAIRRRNVWALFRAGLSKPDIARNPLVNCSRQHVYKIIKKSLDDLEKDTLADVKAVFMRDLTALDDWQARIYEATFGSGGLDENGNPIEFPNDKKQLDILEAARTAIGTVMKRRAEMLKYDGLLGGGAEDKDVILNFNFGKPAEPPEQE